MRLIDADALIRKECGRCDGYCNTFDGETCLKFNSHNKCELRDAIDESHTIDAEPVRHGRWEEYPDKAHLRCSSCRLEFPRNKLPETRKRCPNCGAKMRGEQNE